MAYYQTVLISALRTLEDCDNAEAKIEWRPDSYTNQAAARKGAPCTLKAGAQKKLAAIQKRYWQLAE